MIRMINESLKKKKVKDEIKNKSNTTLSQTQILSFH